MQQVVAKSAKVKRGVSKMPQVVALFVSVPWGHHRAIIDKSNGNRLFNIQVNLRGNAICCFYFHTATPKYGKIHVSFSGVVYTAKGRRRKWATKRN